MKSIKLLSAPEKVLLIQVLCILTGFLLPVLTGGDHFKYNRFYQPLLPVFFASVFSYYCWNQYMQVTLPASRFQLGFLVLAFSAMTILSGKYSFFDFIAAKQRILHYPVLQDFIVSREGRDVAEKANETFSVLPSYPSVGALATGGFAFVYKGPTIDLMGLNDTKMAHASSVKVGYRNHASFDKEVFYKEKPDMMGAFYGAAVVEDTTGFILPENKKEFRTDYANMVYSGYKRIFDDQRFHQTYLPALVNNRKSDFFIFDYFHKEFLARLDTSKLYIKLLERKIPPVPR
jgi:hypothetical protein